MYNQLPAAINDFLIDAAMPFKHQNEARLADCMYFYETEVKAHLINEKHAKLCLAGLQIASDCINHAHEIVQNGKSIEACYWHAFIHRQEGDYSNAAYWFRQTDYTALYTQLISKVQQYLESISPVSELRPLQQWTDWDSYALLDIYRKATKDGELTIQLRELRRVEWAIIMNSCLKKAGYQSHFNF